MKRSKTIIQILSLLVFLGCAVYIGAYFIQGSRAQSDIEELLRAVENYENEPSGGERDEEDAENAEGEPSENEEQPESYAENGMLEKYYRLYLQNNDMVGWIKIGNTKINYPVMYSNSNNDYYLHRNFNKEYSYSGLPFMDYECDLSRPSDNLIIYGHNMKNGTMFADLLKYKNADFCRENQIIYFDTMYEKYEYTVIGVFSTKVGASDEFKYYEFINAETEEEFTEYVSRVKAVSKYNPDIAAEYGDKLLTLSTCSYNTNNERFVVVAKRNEN